MYWEKKKDEHAEQAMPPSMHAISTNFPSKAFLSQNKVLATWKLAYYYLLETSRKLPPPACVV